MDDQDCLAELGDEIKTLRCIKHLTIAMAADKAGISTKHWCNIEHGRVNITLIMADRVGRALKIDPEQLLKIYWLMQRKQKITDSYYKTAVLPAKNKHSVK